MQGLTDYEMLWESLSYNNNTSEAPREMMQKIQKVIFTEIHNIEILNS